MIITQTACSSDTEPVTGENYLLDTVCEIDIYEIENDDGESAAASGEEDKAQDAITAAYKLCSELEQKLSRTIETSEISAVNNAGGEWVSVSDDTLELIKRGLYYSELSGGEFDITIGGVSDLWDFHSEDAALPDEGDLAEAASHVGWENVEIDGNKVRITDPDARIDLGGIAKGYIGDRMTENLESTGVTSAIINLGGNVICIGGKPDADGFNIGIETPYSDRTEVIGSVTVSDKTLVTSGVFERYIESDGKKYHHILSTETGWPVETDLDAVTLIADKGMSGDADAMSTICLIKGYEEARQLIESTDGVEAVFIMADGNVKTTEGVSLN